MKSILGAMYVDAVSGFRGIAVSHTDRIGGSESVQLSANDTRGVPVTQWFDFGRLERLESVPMAKLPATPSK